MRTHRRGCIKESCSAWLASKFNQSLWMMAANTSGKATKNNSAAQKSVTFVTPASNKAKRRKRKQRRKTAMVYTNRVVRAYGSTIRVTFSLVPVLLPSKMSWFPARKWWKQTALLRANKIFIRELISKVWCTQYPVYPYRICWTTT